MTHEINMSGICGWSNNQLTAETCMATLERMARELEINPSYVTGKACFQHCSVAANGGSGAGGVAYQDNLVVAVQGLPRWLDRELAETAKQHGLAQALMQAYRRDGADCLQGIYGPFALAIIDAPGQRTLIAIDRLGIGSLFFTLQKGQLIFASNARAIQHHADAVGGIDPQGIFDYLYFHMVPGPRSIFNGVEKLLPGQYLLVEADKASKGFYWQPTYTEKTPADLAKLESDFRALLSLSVGRAMRGSKVGAFLSGGTDSSTIAGVLGKLAGTPIDTYSIGFDAEGFDEMQYARIASRHFGTRAHEYYLTPEDVVAAIPLIAKAYDEPFGNASAVPAYYCAKLAKADGIEALLAGDGGDELFGGNERYAKQKIFELYQEIPKVLRELVIEPTVFKLPFAHQVWPLAKTQSYIKQAKVPLPDRLESYNFLNRTPLLDIFEEDFLNTVSANEPLQYLRETYTRAAANSALNRMLFMDWKFTLADSDLRKVSRMCELAGVDVHYPLLEQELLEFSTELPTSLKLRNFQLRYFFKHALKDFLPGEILAKKKHGFGLPFGLWLDKHPRLREISQESLESICQRGIIKPTFIKSLELNQQQYPSYYGVMIWVLVMLEYWLQS